jgi:23S rRNA pseudouridine1911/1915/1917 synthase
MINLSVLYEDNNYVIINKPAGLVVHSDGKTKEPTVADWVLQTYGDEIKEVGEPLTLSSGEIIYRPGIVHRIDRDTSGVLVITKNQDSFIYLKDQFQRRDVEKTYNAFVYGEMKKEDGVIDRAITRSRKDFRLWSAQRGGRGEARDAVTEYKVLEKTSYDRHDLGFTYVEVKPKTGRTHQIRVHFKAINHPIIADPLYAPKRKAALGFKRLALHARSITFSDIHGKKIEVEAPLPEDFKEALQILAKRESL